ncbi:hypothetical protein CANCADRAFT_31579 [Tortispora caseinolytica NRRL Y-17796]|uniref:RNA polymerase II elongation factor ELL N-terminal domain-containing protein n=1 Tax=Tortispora caseinolytica NRRL Y-17796 TaxID=767744 RepID=A0A1E4TG36_9ASCO|nr:hypothetical protein CANCADRAFT_31579 [Tortispora caseinolytica NRRL Y-17796]
MDLPDKTTVIQSKKEQNRPIFSIKLNERVLKLIQTALNANQPVKLVVGKGSVSKKLIIGPNEFDLNTINEPSMIEVYEFVNKQLIQIGAISKKVSLNPKQSFDSSILKTSSQSINSLQMRLIHLLALGPFTIDQLFAKLKTPKNEILPLLRQFATKSSNSYYLANEHYEDLRIWDFKGYSTKEREKIRNAALEAFDVLGYPSDHPARKACIEPPKHNRPQSAPLSATRSLPSSPHLHSNFDPPTPTNYKLDDVRQSKPRFSSLSSAPAPTTDLSPAPTADPLAYAASPKLSGIDSSAPKSSTIKLSKLTRSTSSDSSDTLTTAVKRKTLDNSDISSRKKLKPDRNLVKLAHQFKKSYNEYLELYSQVKDTQSANSSSSSDLSEKLISMHNVLLGWKQKIWAAGKNFQ